MKFAHCSLARELTAAHRKDPFAYLREDRVAKSQRVTPFGGRASLTPGRCALRRLCTVTAHNLSDLPMRGKARGASQIAMLHVPIELWACVNWFRRPSTASNPRADQRIGSSGGGPPGKGESCLS
jgi:hypothetical protein